MILSVFTVLVITAGQSFLLYEFTTLRLINSEKHRKSFARFVYLIVFVALFAVLIKELGCIYDKMLYDAMMKH